ncbi:hypothetical protein [Agarivorans gilvus]|uniref:Peptidase M15A C-terminal domain-containing protein n=1 Tax=Agarivorans gilvus TaxID=680279 RepID=A0ABQ1HX39_9ALTE|nr:hypothetical protein [Agarivorans gilvus]GGA93401.1 hypothetical protein GCM10007414_02610 [Agarivorans gilvus]
MLQLLDWYKNKHSEYLGSNKPSSLSSNYLHQLSSAVLTPIAQKLGSVVITYDFTSHPLLRYILNNKPSDMAPKLDQHAAMELNSQGKRICKRDGAACDFYVLGYETKMNEVARFIVNQLNFDRLYFYGKDRPIHLSIGPENTHYALIRSRRSDGVRINQKSAQGIATRKLFNHL